MNNKTVKALLIIPLALFLTEVILFALGPSV